MTRAIGQTQIYKVLDALASKHKGHKTVLAIGTSLRITSRSNDTHLLKDANYKSFHQNGAIRSLVQSAVVPNTSDSRSNQNDYFATTWQVDYLLKRMLS